jgi:hypothetical protein
MRIFIFLIAFISISCNSGEKLFFGANKDKTFSSIEEYKAYIKDKYRFDQKQFYQADKRSYDSLLYYVAENKIDYLLGIFENDSTEYKKSVFLGDNESCVGRIANEVELISKSIHTEKIRNDFFHNNQFINLENQQILDMRYSKTKKIILIVSYKLGRIHKNDFIKIQEIINHKADYELIVLSLDKVFEYQ